jgi:pilus assembly protein CpaE
VEAQDKIRILIVDDVAETRENLRKLLTFDPNIEVLDAVGTGEEGVQLAKETKPHIVLMDINLPGIDGISATELISREVPAAQIIILSVQGETGYMRRAMAAGARDFLVKPPSSDELLSAINRAYLIAKEQAALIAPLPTVTEAAARPAALGRRGHLVTVFSPKGGTGCTTVAVNLSIALQQRLGVEGKVAVLDASFQFGDVGVMLNLQPTRTIADIADRVEDLDSDMLNGAVSPHPSGIKVLLSPPHPEAAESLWITNPAALDGGGPGRVRTIVNNMLKMFDFVIADTWSWVDDVTLTLFDESTLVAMVITPTIPTIKSARLFLDVTRKLGYPRDKILEIINHADMRTGLRVDQIEQALMPASAQIPFDERAGLVAANRGLPLVTEERGKPLADSFVTLAETTINRIEQLSAASQETEAPEEESAEVSRRLLGRVFD